MYWLSNHPRVWAFMSEFTWETAAGAWEEAHMRTLLQEAHLALPKVSDLREAAGEGHDQQMRALSLCGVQPSEVHSPSVSSLGSKSLGPALSWAPFWGGRRSKEFLLRPFKSMQGCKICNTTRSKREQLTVIVCLCSVFWRHL